MIPARAWTVGHSTRSLGDFLELLRAHRIEAIADVRRWPASRRHPHFAGEALAGSLPHAGVQYRHFADRGGRRRPSEGSPHIGWENPSFRAYADHMSTSEFADALAALVALASSSRTAVMCAEAQWWRCHRRLVADALLIRQVEVRHIMSPRTAAAHVLTPFARIEGLLLSYDEPSHNGADRRDDTSG